MNMGINIYGFSTPIVRGSLQWDYMGYMDSIARVSAPAEFNISFAEYCSDQGKWDRKLSEIT